MSGSLSGRGCRGCILVTFMVTLRSLVSAAVLLVHTFDPGSAQTLKFSALSQHRVAEHEPLRQSAALALSDNLLLLVLIS